MHAHLNYTISKMFNIQEKLDMSLHRIPTMNSKTQIAPLYYGWKFSNRTEWNETEFTVIDA